MSERTEVKGEPGPLDVLDEPNTLVSIGEHDAYAISAELKRSKIDPNRLVLYRRFKIISGPDKGEILHHGELVSGPHKVRVMHEKCEDKMYARMTIVR